MATKRPADSVEPPPAKRIKQSYDKYITVLVRPEERHFMVYEDIISTHSKFFAAACNGNFRESRDRIVRLPNECPETFQWYLHWVYTGTVLVPTAFDWSKEVQENCKLLRRYNELVRLYIMADSLDDQELRNATIDAMILFKIGCHMIPGHTTVRIAYDGTSRSSMLRKLLVSFYNGLDQQIMMAWLCCTREGCREDFVFDLAVSRCSRPCPRWGNRCDYHEHDKDAPRCI